MRRNQATKEAEVNAKVLTGAAWILAAKLLAGSSLLAQANESFLLEEVLLRKCQGAALEGNVAVRKPTLVLEADESGSRATASAGYVTPNKRLVARLALSRPITSQETTLATLDGLADSSSAELSVTWLAWDLATYANEMGSWGADLPDRPLRMGASTPSEDSDWIERYERAVEEAEKGLVDKHPVYVNLRAKAGRRDFDFLDSSTARTLTESHTDTTLTGSVGTLMEGKYYVELSYAAGRTFAPGRTATLCDPFGTTGVVECRDRVVAPPGEIDSSSAAFELRRLFRTVGFAARVRRDFERDLTVVDVPLYFLQRMGATSMELNGGIAASWRSDTEDFALRVFVGPALAIRRPSR
jgi:hypothetical protein